ncbi:hypothetical protein [Yoonia maritima]|uniref:hypothetical protein n=1 Tax=Yoonia maritima TaxID=1435347 RepID=UPI000D0F3787|nr:hypothetical protein [Yoonia maritima]
MMDDVENDKNELPNHPDRHAIEDWMLYGPKNGRIEELVRELTLERGLRLREVENIIVDVLLAYQNVAKRDAAAIEGKSASDIDAVRLANDTATQLKILNTAYATGSADAIDAAVVEIVEARRMKSAGIADMLESYSKDGAT